MGGGVTFIYPCTQARNLFCVRLMGVGGVAGLHLLTPVHRRETFSVSCCWLRDELCAADGLQDARQEEARHHHHRIHKETDFIINKLINYQLIN